MPPTKESTQLLTFIATTNGTASATVAKIGTTIQISSTIIILILPLKIISLKGF